MTEKEKPIEEQVKARPCPKDCSLCDTRQHAYCSAQISFYIVEKINEFQIQVADLRKDVQRLKSDNEKELIKPIQNVK